MSSDPVSPKLPRLSFWQTVSSVLAAFFGVQSSRARQRDFSRGDPFAFVVVGVLMTAVFVATLVLVVKLILRIAVPA